MVDHGRIRGFVNPLGDADMRFFLQQEDAEWYPHQLNFDDEFKAALFACLKRGINCWPSVEKADAIRKLIEDMENPNGA